MLACLDGRMFLAESYTAFLSSPTQGAFPEQNRHPAARWISKPNGVYDDSPVETVIAEAFAHWTYDGQRVCQFFPPTPSQPSGSRSNGRLVVCRLEGYMSGSLRICTDYEIHHMVRGLSSCGSGLQGIMQFMRQHVCNRLCKALHLSDPSHGIFGQQCRVLGRICTSQWNIPAAVGRPLLSPASALPHDEFAPGHCVACLFSHALP